MSDSRYRLWWRVLLLVGLAFALLGWLPSALALSPATNGVDWEWLGIGEPVLKLFTPVGGGLFAQTADGLMHSLDDGVTWGHVLPPAAPGASLVAVDPSNAATLYAHADDGLYKSVDGGASWRQMLATPAAIELAVSPADPSLLYVVRSPTRTELEFLRSTDGGMTWTELQSSTGTLCGVQVLLLAPHPSDVKRIFRTAGCYAGRTSSAQLESSFDQGAHWTDLFRPPLSFPSQLVGGHGIAPDRLYLAATRGLTISGAPGASVFRTDDGGLSWAEVFAVPEVGADPAAGVVSVGALAYDPLAPDRLYVGLEGDASGVVGSCDGGLTWTNLAKLDIGSVFDLALSADGAFLYAGTAQGLWRLAVTPPVADDPSAACWNSAGQKRERLAFESVIDS